MRVREIFATNLAAASKPVRLRCRKGLNEYAIPVPLGTAILTCVRALFYPLEVSAAELSEIAANDRFECGAIFRAASKDLRIRRGLEPNSIRLQVLDDKGKFADQDRGVEAVRYSLQQALGQSDPRLFDILNLGDVQRVVGTSNRGLSEAGESWEMSGPSGFSDFSDFDDDLAWEESDLSDKKRTPISLSPQQIARLRSEYTRAREIEELEEQIRGRRGELDAAERELNVITGDDSELSEIRHQLSTMVDLDEVTDEEWKFLEKPAKQLNHLERRLNVLGQRLMKLRDKSHHVEPVWRNPIFVAGTGLAVLCTLISLIGGEALRPVALGNTLCLACTLFGVLQFYRERDELETRGEREANLEQQLLDAEEERDNYEQRLAVLRRKYNVDTAQELQERFDKREALIKRERDLLNERRDAYENQHYVAISAKRHRLQEQIDELRLERDSKGPLEQGSSQIAGELQKLGIPLVAEDDSDLGDATVMLTPDAGYACPFPYLRDMAEELGLVTGGDLLDGVTTSLWGRMLSKLLSRATPAPQISETGDFMAVSGESSWDDMNLSQRSLSVESLLLTILMRTIGRNDSPPLPLVMRSHPYRLLSTNEQEALREVFRTLATHLQLIIFKEAA